MDSTTTKMTAKEKIKKVTEWQSCDYVHELTCDNDSSHEPLEALPKPDTDAGIFLRCPTCGYVQLYIPEIVLDADINEIIKHNNTLFAKNISK